MRSLQIWGREEAPSDTGMGAHLQLQGRGEEGHSATGPMGREDRLLEGLGFFSKKPVCTWKTNQFMTVF